MMWLALVSLAVLCCQAHGSGFSHQNCPAFFVHTDNSCHCGFSIDEETTLYQWTTYAVMCSITANNTYANLYPIYCMSYGETTGIIWGYCPYNSCSRRAESQCTGRGLRFVRIPRDLLLINDIMCGEINRTGVLCSKCKDGLGLAVFTYGLPCVQCLGNTHGWLLYLALALLPSTLFFLLLIALQIHVSSSTLDSMVLMCQIVVNVANWNPAGFNSGAKSLNIFQIFLLTVYGIWNLDFFRYLIPPFCINENMTALQVVSLEYLVALYPLFLITVTYILIELHDRGNRVLVSMWRPFHRCFTRFRRQWNPKATIIHAFASFLLLSYIKIMVTSSTLLRFSNLYNTTTFKVSSYNSSAYVYVDPSLQLFDAHHAPYAALGLFTLLIFTLLPLLLLVVYPLRLTQRFLNTLIIRTDFLREVMQSLQGCYKDGTGQAGERDLRIFSAIFLFCRIVYMMILIIPPSGTFGIVIAFVLSHLVSYLKPYKEDWCNIWSSFVLITIGTMTCAVSLSRIRIVFIAVNVLACLPLLYMLLLVLAVAAKKTHMVKKLKRVYQRVNICPGTAGGDGEDSLPYRLIHPTVT